jgi:hypothetical protein
MTIRQASLVDTSQITTMKDVEDTLLDLDGRLAAEHLTQFLLFNRAYRIVTHLIQQGIQERHFDNPVFIEKFIVQFAGYYFAAVNDTTRSSPALSAPWSKLNEYAKNPSAPIFISLMLSANAHINNDLPQVLRTMMKDEDVEGMLKDIIKLDHLLMKSGKQIIVAFDERNTFLNTLKNRLQFTYYRPAMYTILYWRVKAWTNFKALKDDAAVMPSITNRSIKIANRLLGLSSILARL